MKHSKGFFIAKMAAFGLLAGVAFTTALMLLWNWLMPAIFGLTVITFWQALGLLVLSKILFGKGHRPSWQDREKHRMRKEQFMQRFKKRGCHGEETAESEVADEAK